MDLFGAIILGAAVLWGGVFLFGYYRLLNTVLHLDAASARKRMLGFALRTALSLSVLIGVGLAESVLTAADASVGWKLVGRVSLAFLVVAVGGVWTAWYVYWLLRREYRRRRKQGQPLPDSYR